MNAPHVKRDIEFLGDCGENIRIDARTREIYYRIKDERNQARTEERAASPQDNLKISSSWDSVSNLGLQIIYSESKDIEILAWLAEASLRLRGFHGLREIYDLCSDLFYNHWDSLRSISDDNDEEKFAPFAGLNGIGSEGTLVQPLRLAPLIPGGKFAEHSLWDFQLAQRPNEGKRREELYRAASEAGVAAMSSHLSEVNACLSSFDAIMAVLTERCGQSAPPSSNIRNTLIEAAAAIRTLGGRDLEPAPVEQAPAAIAGTDESGQPVIRAAVVSPEGISSRDEAFETLLSVARYFRRTEPHSPISLSIETLVRRGRMDFSELLAELLPEAQVRNAVLTAAGIKPGGENNGK
ncbi:MULTISPECIES: type VI secretion system protein TssA [Rhizobium/Agrobacterium group]|uniref:type VI secretion system protein TssA n=1 Tax=Rhizobium/Agrobacterium group TaxID=227290 RepID=UPI000DA14634|nr:MULTISPECIES: type VI secretion system protein TssA [Rhizobium/Agrobacterium group]MBO0127834.1 type VI secretion system protein TssA [Agrobacterium sp. OT33]